MYGSGAGNSAFGLGWDLPLASVQRKTDKGLPRYTEDDRFVLVGTDDLVRVGTPDVGPAPLGGSGEPTLRTRYRPRTEGSYLRVERHRRPDTGETFWVTVTPDNVVTVYGRTAVARVADPDRPDRVFSWLPEDVFDDRGNHVHYRWVADNDRGVDQSAPAEANRPPASYAQRYLREVAYLTVAPVADRFAQPPVDHADPLWRNRFHIVVALDYGDYRGFGGVGRAPGIEPDGQWAWRADRFSTCRPGFEVRTQRLCRRLLVFHHFPEALGRDWQLVGATELRHDPDPVAARVVEVVGIGYDGDGTWLRTPPLRLGYRP